MESIQLSDGLSAVPHSDFQKHCDIVNLTAQQQLQTLNLSLQIYKLALEHLNQLDKLLKHLEADKADKLLDNLHILLEVYSSLCFFSPSILY